MGDQFMSDCLICYVEKYNFSTIHNDDVFDLFMKMKDRYGKLWDVSDCISLHVSLKCICLKFVKLTFHFCLIFQEDAREDANKVIKKLLLELRYVNKRF
jgi:hypothetical protein